MNIHVKRYHGKMDYLPIYKAMCNFTENRKQDTKDELWVLEHNPVFTLGKKTDIENLLFDDGKIPLIYVDRGGRITYHGPGQLIVYLLLDLRGLKIYIKELIYSIEQAIIETLFFFNIRSKRKLNAPGVYITEQNYRFNSVYIGSKIAAIGLRIKNHCCYHGLALNVNMDLNPFLKIYPCGYKELKTIDMATVGIVEDIDNVAQRLIIQLQENLYNR